MRILLGLAGAALATLVVFALWPGLDLGAARFFYGAGGFGHTSLEGATRTFFHLAPFIVLGVFVLLYGLRRLGVAVAYAPTGRQLAFLIATIAIGPGFLVNVALKDHSHRPRPAQTKEFNGAFEFRPWYRFDGACSHNCSFVSGEGSLAFWMAAPASLAPPPVRVLLVAGALLFGVLTSILRMAFGGHYLSDVLIAALITLAVVRASWLLFFPYRDTL